MPAIAPPISTPAGTNVETPSLGRVITIRARSDAAMATTTDSSISGKSYPIGTGKRKASMPTKCMLHIPRPITVAPPAIHPNRVAPASDLTRPARSSAANEASMATITESTTNTGS
jgi:hypothetical protein